MSTESMNRLRILAAVWTTLVLASGVLAVAQSGTTVGKAKAKVSQASAQAPAPPASPAPEQGTLTVIETDPNHLSAIKALEQIRRDEESSSEGNVFSYEPGDRRDPFLSPQDVLQAQMQGQVCDG